LFFYLRWELTGLIEFPVLVEVCAELVSCVLWLR
jgi:hypothetical protein